MLLVPIIDLKVSDDLSELPEICWESAKMAIEISRNVNPESVMEP